MKIPECPNDSSHRVVKNGFKTTVEGKKQMWKCQNCGTNITGDFVEVNPNCQKNVEKKKIKI